MHKSLRSRNTREKNLLSEGLNEKGGKYFQSVVSLEVVPNAIKGNSLKRGLLPVKYQISSFLFSLIFGF